MDSITQAALGGLCGEILLRKQLGWKGAAWGVFFGTLPDLDVLMSPWLDSMDSLRNHRSLSHSLFLMLLMSPVFGWLLSKLHKNLSIQRASAFVLLAWSTHVLIDCFNSYGTQIFEPFSNYRVAFGNMAIVDLFFTLPILLGNFICLFLARDSKRRSMTVWLTSSWISLYALLSFTCHFAARAHFKNALEQHNVPASEMLVSPTLSNIFLWRMVARDEQKYYISYWSFGDDESRPFTVDSITHQASTADPYLDSKAFNTLEWFSKGWWKVFNDPEEPNSIYFVDMRFGEIQNFEHDPPVISTPFMWHLSIDDDGNVHDRQTPMRDGVNMQKAIEILHERVSGRAPNWMLGTWPWDLK
jgi:inner membrane protein